MNSAARVLLATVMLWFSAVATSGSALAAGARSGTGGLPTSDYSWGFGYGFYGKGPVYYGQYASPAYDGYDFPYEYPVYTGGNVTAIAVDLVNSRFRHRRVAGPGVSTIAANTRVHKSLNLLIVTPTDPQALVDLLLYLEKNFNVLPRELTHGGDCRRSLAFDLLRTVHLSLRARRKYGRHS